MMAIGVSNVWMLYDYTLAHFDSLDDKKIYIDSYAKMYVEFLKWGITPLHFGDPAAGDVIPVMMNFMDETKQKIKSLIDKKINAKLFDTSKIIIFKNKTKQFTANKIIKKVDLKHIAEALDRSKIIVAPSGVATLNLLDDEHFRRLNIVAFCDLSIGKIGKKLNGVTILSYKEIKCTSFDKIIITSDYFFNDILNDMHQTVDLTQKQILLLCDESVNRRY